MAAKINALIPSQRFELIRNRLGQILMDEFLNQGQLLSPQETIVKQVWLERFISFNEPTEYPALNIVFDEGDYSNKDQKETDGYYKFYIIGHVASPTRGANMGDKLAKIRLQRILGMARAILENPVYNTLDFSASEANIKNTKVGKIVIIPPDPSQTDATNSVTGYLEYYVRVPEDVWLETPVLLDTSVTTVMLYNTNKGYVWGDSTTPPDTTMFTDEDTETEIQYFIAE